MQCKAAKIEVATNQQQLQNMKVTKFSTTTRNCSCEEKQIYNNNQIEQSAATIIEEQKDLKNFNKNSIKSRN